MASYETIIAGGMVIDGRRNPRVRADVAISGGRIAAIGRLDPADAERVIDATGLIIAPGFIDLHTHYDAQIFWDPYCTISGFHGITSVVIGNCGFGFAPVKPADRDYAMRTLNRVEQIPYDTIKAGMTWTWETYPEFLDALDATPKGVNVLPYVGVNPLLTYFMGRQAAKERQPNEAEYERILGAFDEALKAGACGWSGNRTPPGSIAGNHRDYDGTPFPANVMSLETALRLTEVMSRRNTGFIQFTNITNDMEEDNRFVERMAEAGRPIVWNALFVDSDFPDLHRGYLKWFTNCRERGLPVYCQGFTVDTTLTFSLDMWTMWDHDDEWKKALIGDRDHVIAALSDPDVRARLKERPPLLYPLEAVRLVATKNPGYVQYTGMLLTEIAAALDSHVIDVLFDISLAENLTTSWEVPVRALPADEHMKELLGDPYVVPGMSDGGAHTKMSVMGRFPTEHLQVHVREKGWFSLEEMHWKLSALPAHVAGFKDRGTITVGAPADLLVYDFDNLRLLPPEVWHDLPGSEWRRVQRADGYRHILVNGQETMRDGEFTGATPGLLLRHGAR